MQSHYYKKIIDKFYLEVIKPEIDVVMYEPVESPSMLFKYFLC